MPQIDLCKSARRRERLGTGVGRAAHDAGHLDAPQGISVTRRDRRETDGRKRGLFAVELTPSLYNYLVAST